MGVLSGTYSGWGDLLDNANVYLQQVNQSFQLYSASFAALDVVSQTYNSTLLELSEAKSVKSAKEAEAGSAWNNTSDIRQQWYDTMVALEVERNATFCTVESIYSCMLSYWSCSIDNEQ